MKDIESQAMEYAEALNDIADVLEMPTGATAAEIVKAARNRWATVGCSAWLAPCWCGGEAVVRGRTLTCSKRKCGTIIMCKTRAESMRRWNKIFGTNTQAEAPR